MFAHHPSVFLPMGETNEGGVFGSFHRTWRNFISFIFYPTHTYKETKRKCQLWMWLSPTKNGRSPFFPQSFFYWIPYWNIIDTFHGFFTTSFDEKFGSIFFNEKPLALLPFGVIAQAQEEEGEEHHRPGVVHLHSYSSNGFNGLHW